MTPIKYDSRSDKHAKPHARRKRAFPLGDNGIHDADIVTFDDLAQHYPLPQGFTYETRATGVPAVVRASDGKQFHFVIEDGVLTFDETYIALDGRPGSRTHEVFKRRA